MWRIANSNQILSVAGQSISKNKIQFYFLLYWGTQIFTFVLFSPLQENWTLANKKTVGQPWIPPPPNSNSMAACSAPTDNASVCSLKWCYSLCLESIPLSESSLAPLGLTGTSLLSAKVFATVMKDYHPSHPVICGLWSQRSQTWSRAHCCKFDFWFACGLRPSHRP